MSRENPENDKPPTRPPAKRIEKQAPPINPEQSRPREISGCTTHGKQQILGRDGGHGVSDSAMKDAVQNPVSPPEMQAKGTFRYVGRDSIVVLNSKGKVVTAWARNSGGWRNQ